LKIINKILSYRCSFIGYDSRNEETIKKIVSFIPNKIVFDNYLNGNNIYEFFTEKQIMRQVKILELLNKDELTYINIILNLNEIQIENSLTRSKTIKNLVTSLNSKLYEISNANRNIKLILLSSLSKQMESPGNTLSEFAVSGTTPIYVSDYCFFLKKDEMFVIKDREQGDGFLEFEKDKIKISNLIFE
jgi:hypothetical protein